jgi:outer membrane protein assembly factor BamB
MSTGSAGARTFAETRVDPAPLWSKDLGRAVELAPVPWEESWVVAVTQGPLRRLRRANGEEVWKRKLPGTVRGAPVVCGSVVVVALEGGTEEIHAVDLASGEPVWKRTARASLLAGGPDRLLSADDRGVVRRLVPATGDVQWAVELWGAGWRPPISWAQEGLWLVPVRPDSVVALEADTGARRWGSAVGSWPLLAVLGVAAYAATADSQIVRLDPADGRILARRPLGAMPAGPPVAGEDLVHLALRDGTVLAFAPDLAVRWEERLDPPLVSAPVVSRGDLFQAGSLGRVHRLEAATGRVLSAYLHAEFLVASPGVAADQIAVAGDGGRLLAYPRGAP